MCQKHNLSQNCQRSWFLQQDVNSVFSFTLPCSVLLPPSSESLSVLRAPQVISQGRREVNFIFSCNFCCPHVEWQKTHSNVQLLSIAPALPQRIVASSAYYALQGHRLKPRKILFERYYSQDHAVELQFLSVHSSHFLWRS